MDGLILLGWDSPLCLSLSALSTAVCLSPQAQGCYGVLCSPRFPASLSEGLRVGRANRM